MPKAERELREQIVEIGRLMYQKGWVAANDGNVSARLEDGSVLCTPTRISKGLMKPDDLIVMDLQGHKLRGERSCTSEILMHLTIYRERADVGAVVHAHTPVATGFAAAGRALDTAMLPEVVVMLGAVPLAEYGLPGTPELSERLLPLIPRYDALLMANHGVVSYGCDLTDAFFKIETVEHFARIALVSELLGGAKALPQSEIDRLVASRERYGVVSSAALTPGAARPDDFNGDRLPPWVAIK